MKANYKRSKGKQRIESEDFKAEDDPTKANNPWITIIVNLVGILLLGRNFDSIDNAYFSSVAVFILPLFLNYIRFIPPDQKRRNLRTVGMAFHFATLLVCGLGILGIMGIAPSKNGGQPIIFIESSFVFGGGIKFPAYVLYALTFVSFFVASLDPFVATTKAEEKMNEKVAGTAVQG